MAAWDQDSTPVDTNRHTAIHCKHSTQVVREMITQKFVRHCGLDALQDRSLQMLIGDLTAEFTTVMWDHAEELTQAYRIALRRER